MKEYTHGDITIPVEDEIVKEIQQLLMERKLLETARFLVTTGYSLFDARTIIAGELGVSRVYTNIFYEWDIGNEDSEQHEIEVRFYEAVARNFLSSH